MPRTGGGWYQRLLRPFWSSLIVLALLVVAAGSSDAQVHEEDGSSSSLGVASRHGVVSAMIRRPSAHHAHPHAPYLAPEVQLHERPARTAVLVPISRESRRAEVANILARKSRGPPAD